MPESNFTLATPENMRRLKDKYPMAFSPFTFEEYSACDGDYWNWPDNEPLKDAEGNPMILVREVVHYIDAGTGEKIT